jgi:hypothetical protein
MVGKNNQQNRLQHSADRVPHYGLRKLSIGVTSVLLSTMIYLGGYKLPRRTLIRRPSLMKLR